MRTIRTYFVQLTFLLAILLLGLTACGQGSAQNQSFDGHWYDPENPGHSVIIQTFHGTHAIASWTAHCPGNQQCWFTTEIEPIIDNTLAFELFHPRSRAPEFPIGGPIFGMVPLGMLTIDLEEGTRRQGPRLHIAWVGTQRPIQGASGSAVLHPISELVPPPPHHRRAQ